MTNKFVGMEISCIFVLQTKHMYYIPTFTKKSNGLDINKSHMVTEDSQIVLTFRHLTNKGYGSNKPLFVDFEYTINEYGEIQVSDELAAQLIAKFKDVSPKIFETAAQKARARNMTGMLAWTSVMGDHGDTSGQFSR
jgi:hypothetical protein